MPAPQKSTRKNMFKDINVNFRVNSIFGKNKQSFFLEICLKKFGKHSTTFCKNYSSVVLFS